MFGLILLNLFFLSSMFFYVGEMVIGSSIDLANRRKEARGHFPTPAGIKVINKRIKSAVAKFGDYFCPLGVEVHTIIF